LKFSRDLAAATRAAHHEAGHAVAALRMGMVVEKATIRVQGTAAAAGRA
jgi:hypothetical protein